MEQLQSAQCTPKFTQQELLVENHFLKTTTRNSEGRFIVSVPFKETWSELGESRSAALKRLNGVQQKLVKNTDLPNDYETFLKEYEQLGHMT